MALQINESEGRRRFGALLANAPGALYDQPLLERPDWVMAPTLGAIVPGWLLAIPRQWALNFRDVLLTGGQSACAVLEDVQRELGLSPDEIIWFEHGPATAGTAVGCGLDHAHLHILIRPQFSFSSFVEHARAGAALDWHEVRAVDSYEMLRDGRSYCITGCGSRAVVAQGVETVGSQFFRRVVATLIGAPSRWDYRSEPHTQNVEATVTLVRRLMEVAKNADAPVSDTRV